MIVQVKSVQPQPTYVHRLISDLSRAIVLLIASFCAIAFADPPTDLPETVAKSVLTDSGAWGIVPGGSISVMYPMGSTPPQIEDSKGAGYTTVTLSGRALDVRTQLVWFFRKDKYFSGKIYRAIATIQLAQGLDEGILRLLRFG